MAKLLLAAASLICVSNVHALSPLHTSTARLSVKGGAYDINGYNAEGYELLTELQGKDLDKLGGKDLEVAKGFSDDTNNNYDDHALDDGFNVDEDDEDESASASAGSGSSNGDDAKGSEESLLPLPEESLLPLPISRVQVTMSVTKTTIDYGLMVTKPSTFAGVLDCPGK